MFTSLQQTIITNTQNYVKDKLAHDYSGHDIAHIERVVKLAQHIQATEPQTDPFIITISAYLHDVIDDKVVKNTASARNELIFFMQQQNITPTEQQKILHIIDNMSFSKNLSQKQSISQEGKIVQDADRLDALGAIGIGRTFYYGGNKKNIMHDPNIQARTAMTEAEYRRPNTVINHFYEKLFLLKDQMNTQEGKRLAKHRHNLLVSFVDEFEKEWLSHIEQ